MTPLDWKIRRIRVGLKQQDVANRLGISRRLLVYFEGGKRELSPEKLAAMHKLYQEATKGGQF